VVELAVEIVVEPMENTVVVTVQGGEVVHFHTNGL